MAGSGEILGSFSHINPFLLNMYILIKNQMNTVSYKGMHAGWCLRGGAQVGFAPHDAAWIGAGLQREGVQHEGVLAAGGSQEHQAPC